MRTVRLEVPRKGSTVFSNLTKVDRPTTSCQEEQSVKLLHEDSRRLMDRAKDSLAVIREFTHQAADGPGGLRIQSTRLNKE